MGTALARYYDGRDPFGINGDFITAPEISQLFGEIIGIWAVQQWINLGSPATINLIELGPGRGTLMADLLRGTKHIKPFCDAIRIHLVETSHALTAVQKSTLCHYDVKWHTHLDGIDKNTPAIIIANEFFDALPIRQFKFSNNIWHEHYIDNGQSVWITVDGHPQKPGLATPKDGDIYEYSQEQVDYAASISRHKGSYLIIDYGYARSAYGDSLQALYKHRPCPVTTNIGKADLTSHIDFQWLAGLFTHAKPAIRTHIKTQRKFLVDNGITARMQQLNDPRLVSGYNRLTDVKEMGDLFKTLEIFNPDP